MVRGIELHSKPEETRFKVVEKSTAMQRRKGLCLMKLIGIEGMEQLADPAYLMHD